MANRPLCKCCIGFASLFVMFHILYSVILTDSAFIHIPKFIQSSFARAKFAPISGKHNVTPTHPKLLIYNKNICTGQSNLTLMYVYSKAEAEEKRNVIRETYGSKTVQYQWNIRVVFVMGLAEHGTGPGLVPVGLIEEYQSHADLIIGEFQDTYRNLSYKGLAAFNFITHHCSNAKYVIKTDDDVIVNIQVIMTWLHDKFHQHRRTIYGHYHTSYRAFICPDTPKWCVTKEEYPREMHPRYMSGVGIVFTADIIPDLYKASLDVPLFFIDDVYITGLLGERVEDKTMVDWAPYIPYHARLQQCSANQTTWPLLFAHAQDADVGTLRQCWAEFVKQSGGNS